MIGDVAYGTWLALLLLFLFADIRSVTIGNCAATESRPHRLLWFEIIFLPLHPSQGLRRDSRCDCECARLSAAVVRVLVMCMATDVGGANTWVLALISVRGKHAENKTNLCRMQMFVRRASATWWHLCGTDLQCVQKTRLVCRDALRCQSLNLAQGLKRPAEM